MDAARYVLDVGKKVRYKGASGVRERCKQHKKRRRCMAQLVFLHGPGAGGCAEAFRYQLEHFPGSLAPTLPGHPDGAPCASVERYTEWLRGWLWARSSGRRAHMNCGCEPLRTRPY